MRTKRMQHLEPQVQLRHSEHGEILVFCWLNGFRTHGVELLNPAQLPEGSSLLDLLLLRLRNSAFFL